MPGRNNTAYHSTLHHRGKQAGVYWRCAKKQATLPDLSYFKDFTTGDLGFPVGRGGAPVPPRWEATKRWRDRSPATPVLGLGSISRKTLLHNTNTMNVNDLLTSRLVRFRTRPGRSVQFRTVMCIQGRSRTLRDVLVRIRAGGCQILPLRLELRPIWHVFGCEWIFFGYYWQGLRAMARPLLPVSAECNHMRTVSRACGQRAPARPKRGR